jgi:hypothetical protein
MKDVMFIWGLPQEDSCMKLKELVTSAPSQTMTYHSDLRLMALASLQVQYSRNSLSMTMHGPVTFLSKALNPMERNYEIHDTEMLAIIQGLEEWRHYLEGARHPVEIWTDHKNLKYFRVAQKLNC